MHLTYIHIYILIIDYGVNIVRHDLTLSFYILKYNCFHHGIVLQYQLQPYTYIHTYIHMHVCIQTNIQYIYV